jgi:hypothetical protein
MVAETYGSEFVTWHHEGYDLIIPERESDAVPVPAILQGGLIRRA